MKIGVTVLLGVILVIHMGCSRDQQRAEGWDVYEDIEDAEFSDVEHADVRVTEPSTTDLPELPFVLEEDVVIHRHSIQDPTSTRSLGGGNPFHDEELYQRDRTMLVHTHSIQLEVPGGLPILQESGRVYVMVPGSVLQTPETHLFEVLSRPLRPERVLEYPGWWIDTEAWGRIAVHAIKEGIYIRSHPKPREWTDGDSQIGPETTFTDFNRPGTDGPIFDIRVWTSDQPAFRSYTLKRGPRVEPMEFDIHRAYYRTTVEDSR